MANRANLERMCLARDLLNQIQDESPSIEEVARLVRMSPFHFIRRFDAFFGATPHQFRINARLERARHLLSQGQHSVTDVCLDVGFSSLGSFSDLFTRRVGEPPSAYRRRARSMVQVPGILPSHLTPGCLTLMGRLPPDVFRNFQEAR